MFDKLRSEAISLLANLDKKNDRSTTRKTLSRFLETLQTKRPELFKKFMKATNLGRASPARGRFEALIHNIMCEICGEKYTLAKHHGICNVCCSLDSSHLQERRRRGYISRGDRFEAVHGAGIRAPQQVKTIRETTRYNNQRVWGASHPMSSARGKRIHVNALQKKFGENVTNSMHIPGVVKKQQANNLLKHGTECTLNTEKSIRQKKRTWQENYGVSNPSQALEIFRKKTQLNRRLDINGKSYIVQGSSEEQVLLKLVEHFSEVQTPFSRSYPKDTFSRTAGFPDFYLPTEKIYVECKSIWTFYGSGKGYDHLKRNLKRAEKYSNRVRWIIHFKVAGKDRFIKLPKSWWRLSRTTLVSLVNKRIHLKGK